MLSFLQDPSFVVFGLTACVIILTGWILYVEIKMRRLMKGKDAKSLEEIILSAHTEIDKLKEHQKDSIAYLSDVEKRLGRSVQAVETIRFNPFKGTGEGGNQSFSTAFISENGNGVVISSLYSRDRVSIFSKPLNEFKSEFELTDEERGVVEEAKIHISK